MSREREGGTAAHRPDGGPGQRRSHLHTVAARLRAAREIYEGVFFAPYGRAIQREYLTQHDAFLLLSFSDLLGIPNPVHFYTLELYPELLEQFHEWHLRMGMPHAPEEGWRCC
jgi:hypothetical protein